MFKSYKSAAGAGFLAIAGLWIIGILLNLALIAGAVWVVVYVLRAMGVIA